MCKASPGRGFVQAAAWYVYSVRLLPPRRRIAGLTTVFVLVVTTLVACSSSHHTPSSSASSSVPPSGGPTGSTAGGGPPPAVPRAGAYLGAWVNSVKRAGTGDTNTRSLAQVPNFKLASGSSPAILNLYTPWASPAPISNLQSIVAQGATPLIAWGCTTTATVNSGQDDALISNYAQSLKSFGHPVFLRWFWEMNLKIPKDAACVGSGGPKGFISAWQRVWSIFHRVGATNVAFVWCPGISGSLARLKSYFPGVNYVDWIAVDGYDRRSEGSASFANVFGAWYRAFSGYGKPLMIGETGALSNDQAAYLAGIRSSLPSQFPQIKALVYFDAKGPAGAWQLVGSGLQAFHELATDPYFSMRS